MCKLGTIFRNKWPKKIDFFEIIDFFKELCFSTNFFCYIHIEGGFRYTLQKTKFFSTDVSLFCPSRAPCILERSDKGICCATSGMFLALFKPQRNSEMNSVWILEIGAQQVEKTPNDESLRKQHQCTWEDAHVHVSIGAACTRKCSAGLSAGHLQYDSSRGGAATCEECCFPISWPTSHDQ